jgi:hypothetical protein
MFLSIYFLISQKKSEKKLKDSIIVFCFLHYIHFIYLALAVYLNNIPIIPARLAGGFIAYLMILIYPFIISKIEKIIYHLIYFYYVGIVMVVTILGRVRGNFEGAEPEFFHYVGLASVILGFVYFTSVIIRSKNPIIK